MLDASRRGGEARVGAPRRVAHGPPECLPLFLGAARHHHPLVVPQGPVRARRRARGVGAPVARREARSTAGTAVEHGVEKEGARQRRRRLELGDVHVLSLARAAAVDDPGQDGDGPEVAAHVVQVGERPPRRGPVGQAHQEGEPRQGLGGGAHGHVGGVGALVSEPAHRHVDDVGTDLAHDLVGEAPAIERARREALGHDVGVRHEVLQQRQALGVARVHGDAPLPARVVLVEDPPRLGLAAPVALASVAAPNASPRSPGSGTKGGMTRMASGKRVLSTRMTSAPRHPQIKVACAPKPRRVKSRMRRPSSAMAAPCGAAPALAPLSARPSPEPVASRR